MVDDVGLGYVSLGNVMSAADVLKVRIRRTKATLVL